ncbi:MAG: oxidoreductase [Lachnospiraceae bacterium]|nr:oxidoreductase [Lachnospiraceae bacterium]
MACSFHDTLHYSSPANGGRGIVRTGMLVPESVELFVCPFACGRHGAISAVKQNLKQRLSYLYVNQADIVNGYDDLIIPAVGELLETLQKKPKVVLIFVSCLDDLIGTDHEALQEKLEETYPGIAFRSCHMNPISKGSKTPPGISIQNNTFSLLNKREDRDENINSLGNLIPVDEASELYPFLETLGCANLRHITHYETFEGYQDMAKSRANLVITPVARQAAEQMKKKHGMSYCFVPVSYRIEQIEQDYEHMYEELRKPGTNPGKMDFTIYKEDALKKIEEAKSVIKDMPIIVDASATKCPFGLARALVEYGFHVVRVQAPEVIGIDKGNFEWLCENHPEIEVVESLHHKSVLRENQIPDSIAIGVDGAYLAGSKYVMDLFDDEGMFGYHGVSCIMEKLAHAMDAEVELEKMIHEYGLVV